MIDSYGDLQLSLLKSLTDPRYDRYSNTRSRHRENAPVCARRGSMRVVAYATRAVECSSFVKDLRNM